MTMNLLEWLGGGQTLLLDGAMGTQLSARGAESGGLACIESAEAVLAVHREYVECGCDVVTTNTLTMNRIYIEIARKFFVNPNSDNWIMKNQLSCIYHQTEPMVCFSLW